MGAGGLAAAAVAVLLLRGPETPAVPTAAAPTSATGADGKSLDDVDTMISRLAARLEKEPNDGEGFRMLGWSHVMTGHPERAIEPYKRALALLPNSALVHSGYAEALAGASGGKVSAAAKAEFERALAIDPKEPRARYFLALWQAQNGQQKEALEKWIALANSGSADAPWQVDVRRQLTEVSGKLGIDVSSRLKNPAPKVEGASAVTAPQLDPATVQAASALPESDRAAMVDQMVAGLVAKLKANPKDADRWVLLLRSRMVLKQPDQARSDLDLARKSLAGDSGALGKVNAAALELRVPGA
ncbi:tetratricopeptide repeat protein [Novosphingobium sp.]|uniref:tetratricopeptide repeat protein n=1 Tax=Novosphingobium sp. TaxID=1874826 RepID=UPI00286E7279|nr:tetratricopeptide repeat protein [Novosphingobium sp.]